MKFEFSAGGVVYRQDDQKTVFILISQHSQHHGWVFPKGLIGDTIKGETKAETAIREVKEETGIDAAIVQELEPVTYWYQFEGQRVRKTVYYYVMKHLGGDVEKRDMEMETVEWLRIDQVFDRLTYKSDKKVFKYAEPIIKKLTENQ